MRNIIQKLIIFIPITLLVFSHVTPALAESGFSELGLVQSYKIDDERAFIILPEPDGVDLYDEINISTYKEKSPSKILSRLFGGDYFVVERVLLFSSEVYIQDNYVWGINEIYDIETGELTIKNEIDVEDSRPLLEGTYLDFNVSPDFNDPELQQEEFNEILREKGLSVESSNLLDHEYLMNNYEAIYIDQDPALSEGFGIVFMWVLCVGMVVIAGFITVLIVIVRNVRKRTTKEKVA